MDGPSPARLFATVVGALLIVGGMVGFFHSASFGTPGSVEVIFGAFAVNGWSNACSIATGAIGLLVAGFAARTYAAVLGALCIVLAVWGFAIGNGDAILNLIPVETGDVILNLTVGALGLAAAAATPQRAKVEFAQ